MGTVLRIENLGQKKNARIGIKNVRKEGEAVVKEKGEKKWLAGAGKTVKMEMGRKKETKKEKKNVKPQRKVKNDGSLPEAVYNKLWCIDLAIEQALEKCVEAKIQN